MKNFHANTYVFDASEQLINLLPGRVLACARLVQRRSQLLAHNISSFIQIFNTSITHDFNLLTVGLKHKTCTV